MGQYFVLVNLDKKEYINSWSIDSGSKLWEWCANNGGGLLLYLLRKSSEGGGGDIREASKYAGRWAGDRIVLVGDYDESKLYDEISTKGSGYKDIGKLVIKEYNKFIEIPERKIGPEHGTQGNISPDMVAIAGGLYIEPKMRRR